MACLRAAFIALQAICLALNIAPIAWHISNRNLPAVVLLLLFELMNLKGLVDVSVWGGDNYLTAWNGKGWCDIMIRVETIAFVGCYSTLFCILLNLFLIFMVNKATIWWFSHLKTRIGIEVFCSIIFPLIIMAASQAAISQRYSIYQMDGCTIAMSKDGVSILVFFFWIFFWCFLDVCLTVGTVILFFRKRKTAKNILVCTNSGMSMRKFMRLLLFCLTLLAILILTCLYLGLQLRENDAEFYSSQYHSKMFSQMVLRFAHESSLDIIKWVFICCSFIGFLAFGTGKDAMEMYTNVLEKLPYGYHIVSTGRKWKRKCDEKAKENYITRHFTLSSPAKSTATTFVAGTSNLDAFEKKEDLSTNLNYSETSSPSETVAPQTEDAEFDLYNDPDLLNVLKEEEEQLKEENKLHDLEANYDQYISSP